MIAQLYWKQLIFYCRLLRLLPVLASEIVTGRWIVWPSCQKLMVAVVAPIIAATVACGVGVRLGFMRMWFTRYVKWFLSGEEHVQLCSDLDAVCKNTNYVNVTINQFIACFEKAWKKVRKSRKGELLHTIGLLLTLSFAIVKLSRLKVLTSFPESDRLELGALLVTVTLLFNANYRLGKQHAPANLTWYFAAALLFILLAAISVGTIWSIWLGTLLPWSSDIVHGISVFGLSVAIGAYDFIAARSVAAQESQKRIEMWIFGDVPTTLAVGAAVIIRWLISPAGAENLLAGVILGLSLVFVVIYILVEAGIFSKILKLVEGNSKASAAKSGQ